MLYRVQSTALGQSGTSLVLLPGAQVAVRDKNSDLARIYADADQVTELLNPLTADASGGFDFFVALDDYYDVTVSAGSSSISDRIYPFDPSDIVAAQTAADAAQATADTALGYGKPISFASRAELATWAAGNVPIAGREYRADGLSYRGIPVVHILYGTNPIADIPGMMPGFDVTPEHFGADVTGATDCAAQTQAASSFATQTGSPLRITRGSYLLSSTVTHDLTGYTSESDELGSPIVGDGSGVTEIIVGSAGAGIKILGDNTTGAGGHGQSVISGVKFRGATAQVGTGLQIEKLAFMSYVDLFFNQLADGLIGDDILSSRFYNVRGRYNKRCVTLNARTTFSGPNSLTFYGPHFGHCSEYGLRSLGGSQLSIFGGSIEKCGLTGSSGLEGGIRIESAGLEGAVGCNIQGVYFEGNKGDADVVVLPGTSPAIYNVNGCNFNRVSSTDFTTRNIYVVTSAGDGQTVLQASGNGFRGYNTYVEDAARPYIQILDAGNCARFEDGGNYYSDVVAWPNVRGFHPVAGCSFDGTLATPVLANKKNVASITKNGVGDYTLTFLYPIPTKRALSVSVNGAAVGWNFGDTTTSIRIRTTSVGGILTDYSSIIVEVSV